MNIVTLTMHSVNCYLVGSGAGYLMIDTGWAGDLPLLIYLMKQKDVQASDIKYLLVTHFHGEHGGLAQDLKNLGAKLLVHECQPSFIEGMARAFKPTQHYTPIEEAGNKVVDSHQSRLILEGMGITGSIIPTPGHSDDSVSVIVDDSCAFVGDLPRLSGGAQGQTADTGSPGQTSAPRQGSPTLLGQLGQAFGFSAPPRQTPHLSPLPGAPSPLDRETIKRSWDAIEHYNVKVIYPGHGRPFEL